MQHRRCHLCASADQTVLFKTGRRVEFVRADHHQFGGNGRVCINFRVNAMAACWNHKTRKTYRSPLSSDRRNRRKPLLSRIRGRQPRLRRYRCEGGQCRLPVGRIAGVGEQPDPRSIAQARLHAQGQLPSLSRTGAAGAVARRQSPGRRPSSKPDEPFMSPDQRGSHRKKQEQIFYMMVFMTLSM